MASPLRQRLLKEIAFVLVVGTPVLLFFLAARPRANASRLLKQLHTVEVGTTQFRAVEALAQRFAPFGACVGGNCLFQFQNTWMHTLGLAPATEFTVMVRRGGDATDAGGGTVGAIDMAMLVSRDRPGGEPIASALMFDRAAGAPMPGPPSYASQDEDYRATVTVGTDGVPGRTVVVLTPRATARQRARARAFNLACLTHFGGCRSSKDLLPQVYAGARRVQMAGMPGGD